MLLRANSGWGAARCKCVARAPQTDPSESQEGALGSPRLDLGDAAAAAAGAGAGAGFGAAAAADKRWLPADMVADCTWAFCSGVAAW